MRRIALTIVFLLLVQQIMLPLPIETAALKYKPAGNTGTVSAEGDIKAQNVGSLSIQQGVAVVRENSIDIQAPKPGSNLRETVLTGSVIIPKLQTAGKQGKLSGYVFFNGGKDLAQIDDPDVEELISVEGGDVVTGRITSVGREKITIATKGTEREIPTDKIKRICSPRVYQFLIALTGVESVKTGLPSVSGSAGSISLNPTTHRCRTDRKAESSTGAKRKKRQCCIEVLPAHHIPKLAVVAVGATLLATAITLPIVIPLATRNRHVPVNPSNVAVFNFLTRKPPPAPTPSGSGSSSPPPSAPPAAPPAAPVQAVA